MGSEMCIRDRAMDKIDPLLDDVIPEQDTEEDELGES